MQKYTDFVGYLPLLFTNIPVTDNTFERELTYGVLDYTTKIKYV
jgi:hypothetical protein